MFSWKDHGSTGQPGHFLAGISWDIQPISQQLQPGGVGTLIRHTLLLKKKISAESQRDRLVRRGMP